MSKERHPESPGNKYNTYKAVNTGQFDTDTLEVEEVPTNPNAIFR